MTVSRVTTFNVNQFSPLEHQKADLLKRMVDSDVVLCQETVDLDLVAFAATVPGWGAFQVRHGNNDGHANTGVLYRLINGRVTETDCTFLVDTKGERRRFLTAVKQAGVWDWSAHINPKRFAAGIPTQLAHIEAWVKAHPGPQVGGLDRNQCPPGALENATGMKWHGVGIDGLLSNLHVANIAEFPKGFSDHPGVHGDVSLPGKHEGEPVTTKPTWLQGIRAQLRRALAHFRETGRKKNAAAAQAALKALRPPKGKPSTKPDPVPVLPYPAIRNARDQSHNGPQFGLGQCLLRVRECYGIPSGGDFDGDGDADAEDAWKRATKKHRTSNPASIPRGYPVYWLGGSHDNGHIAISTGAGQCWSSDIVRTGFFDFVEITEIHDQWGLELVGWSEDLNGVLIDPHTTGAKP